MMLVRVGQHLLGLCPVPWVPFDPAVNHLLFVSILLALHELLVHHLLLVKWIWEVWVHVSRFAFLS